MALPKRKHSRARTRKRRANQGLTMPSLRKCPSCSTVIRTHTVCPECGSYRGKTVVKVEKKVKEKKKK